MKKIIIFVISILFGITSVNALTVVVETSNEVISWEFETTKVSKYYAYKLSPFDDYVINYSNATTINNLAYLGNTYTSLAYQATIQVLILQAMYPEYNIYLLDGDEVFDYSAYQKVLERNLATYESIIEYDGNYYEAYYGEMFFLRGSGLSVYTTEDAKVYGIYDGVITFYPFEELGLHEIYIHAVVNTRNGYVYSSKSRESGFTIYVNVLGNTLYFDLENIDQEYTFEIYTEDGEYLSTITVNKDNTTFTYTKGINIKLYDITESDTYESLDTISVTELEDISNYTIYLSSTLKPVEISFETLNIVYNTDEIISTAENNLTVTLNGDEVADCKKDCTLSLTPDTYSIIDNITGNTYDITVTEDDTITLYRYVINGFYFSYQPIEVSLSGTQTDNYYYLDDYLLIDTYNITIDDIEYVIDLSNTDNYIYTDEGIFYRVNLIEKESIEEQHLDTQDETIEPISTEIILEQDETIEIEIPNTGIEQSALTCDVKKYYFYLK